MAVMLDTWYETQPDEVQRSRRVNILKSLDTNKVALAGEIEMQMEYIEYPKIPSNGRTSNSFRAAQKVT